MTIAILCLTPASFVISWLVTQLMRSAAPRLGFVDQPGGRKIHDNPKPLGGGIGIFVGFALPLLIAIVWVSFFPPPDNILPAYWSGAREQSPLGLKILLACVAIVLLGLWDDRKALGPYVKLVAQLAIIAGLVAWGDLRILTVAGPTLSLIITILWIAAITNAFNFLDNMDGLSAGVASVCAVAFLVTTLSIGQWFVAAALALLLGSMLGFLCHNFPPAKIFMGDAGSMLIGLLLGILTVRTTYLAPGSNWSNRWYAVFAPVIVLALPLYDLVVVSIIRLSRGKSPFVGDTNHFSHRLVARGMSRRSAVLCLYLVAAATSVSAIVLPHVGGDLAVMIAVQTLLILGMVALLEQHPLPPT